MEISKVGGMAVEDAVHIGMSEEGAKKDLAEAQPVLFVTDCVELSLLRGRLAIYVVAKVSHGAREVLRILPVQPGNKLHRTRWMEAFRAFLKVCVLRHRFDGELGLLAHIRRSVALQSYERMVGATEQLLEAWETDGDAGRRDTATDARETIAAEFASFESDLLFQEDLRAAIVAGEAILYRVHDLLVRSAV